MKQQQQQQQGGRGKAKQGFDRVLLSLTDRLGTKRSSTRTLVKDYSLEIIRVQASRKVRFAADSSGYLAAGCESSRLQRIRAR